MANGSGQARVLVVSEDPLARDIHAQFLRMGAYDVLLAESGERALLMLRQLRRRIDWLFTATRLPGLVDGWMLAHEFHHLHPSRTVILASDAESHPSLASDSMLVLQNPVSPIEVVTRFHALTGRTPALESAAPLPLVARAASIPPAPPLARRSPAPMRAAS